MRPVFVRENASKMYSPSAYYLAGYLSTVMMVVLYPYVSSLISYSILKFYNKGFENYVSWSSMLAIMSLEGMSFGYMLGCIFDDMDMGINIFSLFIMFYVMGSGIYKIGRAHV